MFLLAKKKKKELAQKTFFFSFSQAVLLTYPSQDCFADLSGLWGRFIKHRTSFRVKQQLYNRCYIGRHQHIPVPIFMTTLIISWDYSFWRYYKGPDSLQKVCCSLGSNVRMWTLKTWKHKIHTQNHWSELPIAPYYWAWELAKAETDFFLFVKHKA